MSLQFSFRRYSKRKIIAQIMDPELDNPQIIPKGSALNPEGEDGIESNATKIR